MTWPRYAAYIASFFAAALLTLATQWHLNAYKAMFGADSSAHYVIAAMIHDWLLTWPVQNPLRYLINFHAHYPLVNIGGWPPAFHTFLAGWMVILPGGHGGALLFSAAVTVLLALMTALTLRRLGWQWAVAGAAAIIMSPSVRIETAQVMVDVLTAAFCFGAALVYARYLQTGQWQASVLFGAVAVLALYTKGNAASLALLPPLAVLLARRPDMMRHPAFWAAVPVVLVIAGPWYILTAGRSQEGARFTAGLAYTAEALPFYIKALLDVGGPLVLALAFIELVRIVLREGTPLLASCAALVLATLLFHVVTPIALQERYVIMALPALVVLAANLLNRILPGLAGPGLVVASALVWTTVSGPAPFPESGLAQAARQVHGTLKQSNPVILIVTDAHTEGALVAELAASDPKRPSVWALRGSRLLGGGGYNNHDYTARFADASAVLAEMERYGIPFVLLRQTSAPSEWAHVGQVAQLAAQDSRPWRELGRFPHPGGDVVLLEVPGQAARVADPAALTQLAGPRALLGSSPD